MHSLPRQSSITCPATKVLSMAQKVPLTQSLRLLVPGSLLNPRQKSPEQSAGPQIVSRSADHCHRIAPTITEFLAFLPFPGSNKVRIVQVLKSKAALSRQAWEGARSKASASIPRLDTLTMHNSIRIKIRIYNACSHWLLMCRPLQHPLWPLAQATRVILGICMRSLGLL
jgi:hypothetical protein